MPGQQNNETQEALSQQIKAIKIRCIETCNAIENAPLEQMLPTENVEDKALCYVEGLRTEIENSSTPIVSDDNLLTSQFLNELKERTSQLEELIVLKKGTIYDTESEINRLKNQITIAQEAKSRPRGQKQQVQPEHVQKGKERFQQLKTELNSVMFSLFPDKADEMRDLLGELMNAKLAEDSTGYVPITSENFCLVEILRERNIISSNPYNNMEIKLAY